MSEAPKRRVLTGHHVQLEPLSIDHLDALVEAATARRPDSPYTFVPDDRAAMERYITTMTNRKGRSVYAQRDLANDRIVGCTGFMEPIWWRGRFAPDEIEIGMTWLDRTAQRTGINTEAKLLLLTHAFELWETWRVCFTIDERNTQSRRAIERIGAQLEGILRRHQTSDHPDESGQPRNTAMYSIIDTEWPAVKQRLRQRLDR